MVTTYHTRQLLDDRKPGRAESVGQETADRQVTDQFVPYQPTFTMRRNRPVHQAGIPHPDHELRNLDHKSRTCLADVMHSGKPTAQSSDTVMTIGKIPPDPIEHLRRQPLIDQTSGDRRSVIQVLL